MAAHAFDDLARTYDATFTDTGVGKALREIVWSRVDRLFHASQCVLELGCGTGEDALRLARRGIRILATDASPGMIQVAREKARSNRLAERIEFHCKPMEELEDCLNGRVFDGVFSNFGAINCVHDLPALVSAVAARLVPGAPLLWVLMGRHVPWEWVWYLFRGDWRKASRRLRRGGVPWRGLTICYPTPAEITAHLRPYFAITRILSLGCVLPPSYAAHWLNRSPRMLEMLTRIELLAQRSSAPASWSDHYIVEATRLPPPAATGRSA